MTGGEIIYCNFNMQFYTHQASQSEVYAGFPPKIALVASFVHASSELFHFCQSALEHKACTHTTCSVSKHAPPQPFQTRF